MYKVAGSVGAALLYLTLGKQYPLSVLGGEFASYPYSVDSSIIPSVLVFSRESTLAHNNGHAHNNCVINLLRHFEITVLMLNMYRQQQRCRHCHSAKWMKIFERLILV